MGHEQMSEEGKPCDRGSGDLEQRAKGSHNTKACIERTNQPNDLCLPETLLIMDVN